MTTSDDELIRERLLALLEYCDEAGVIVVQGRDAFLTTMVNQRAAEAILNRIAATIANGLPDDVLAQHPDQPWEAMRGMRNRVVHEYRQMDWTMVWGTLERDIPQLHAYVRGMLDTL